MALTNPPIDAFANKYVISVATAKVAKEFTESAKADNFAVGSVAKSVDLVHNKAVTLAVEAIHAGNVAIIGGDEDDEEDE